MTKKEKLINMFFGTTSKQRYVRAIILFTEIAGNSKAHRLHFEVWKDGTHFNPIEYFNYRGIDYD